MNLDMMRVFRRRRRPRSSLARLLSDVTESCHSWLDHKVFRGVFGTGLSQDQEQLQDLDLDLDLGQDWTRSSREQPALLDLDSWSSEKTEERSFTYDHTEVPPPPDKLAPPSKQLIQEEICSEICQSKEQFPLSLGGLSEVPPPSSLYCSSCCQSSAHRPGLTVARLLLLVFSIFVLSAMSSGSVWSGVAAAAVAFAAIAAIMWVTRSGPVGEWRRAKTEVITSRNE